MVLQGHYDLWLVALSFVIASVASYVALCLAMRHSAVPTPNRPRRFNDVVPPALVLGLGIWAMHFTGMAAFSINGMTIGYRPDLTILSLLVAVVFTAFGFATLALAGDMRESFALAGLPMGCGILTMHFLGMMAMTGTMDMNFRPTMILAAAVIAIGASIVALWLTTLHQNLLRTVVAALVMGLAICGMHYTGMRAATFSATTASMHPPETGSSSEPGHATM